MNNILNDEDKTLLDHISHVCRNEIPKYATSTHYNTIPRELLTLFGIQGLAGLTIAPEFDGLGKSPLLLAKVMEVIASINLGPAIFLSVHLMVAGLIQRHGNNEQKKKYLPRLASGELLGAFALTEPSAGSDAASLKTEAIVTGSGFILNGEKCYITSAGWADLYIVFARTDPKTAGGDGISAFIVDKNTTGLSIGKPEKKMGCELSPIASLNFDQCKLPKEALLGELHQGYKVALSGLNGGRVNIAACANGLSRAAIDRSIAHLKERKQFGQALSSFQGLQFILADMKILYDAASVLTEHAAQDMSTNLNPSVAKCFATDAAMKITTDAVQLLGGAGYIQDYGVEALMRDAKMLQIVEGTNQIQRMVIAKQILS